MPEKRHTVEERARILSVYLRPWVLTQGDVSTHVPHLTELNTVRLWNVMTRPVVRKRCKTSPVMPQRCSYREAWKDYLRGHIVSAHASRIIGNFLANTCCYSSQAPDHEEPEVNAKNIEKMPALSMSLAALHESLQFMTKALDVVGGGATGQIRRDVQSGCVLANRLWNLSDLQKKQFSRTFMLQGHLDQLPEDEEVEEETGTAPSSRRKAKPKAKV